MCGGLHEVFEHVLDDSFDVIDSVFFFSFVNISRVVRCVEMQTALTVKYDGFD